MRQSKHHTFGHAAELRLALELQERGYTVSKPLCDAAGYDLIVDTHKALLRVQVKASNPSKRRPLHPPRHVFTRGNGRKFDVADFDILACWFEDAGEWEFVDAQRLHGVACYAPPVTRKRGGKAVRSNWQVFA